MEISQTPLSIRPPKELRPRVKRLADELGKSEGQLFNECAAAIIELVEDDTPLIPSIVMMARTLRQHRATMLDPRRPFPPQDGEKLVIVDPLPVEQRERLVASRQEPPRKRR